MVMKELAELLHHHRTSFFVEIEAASPSPSPQKKEWSPGDFLHGQQQEALAITGDLRYLLDHLPKSCAYLAVPIVSCKLRDVVIYLLTATYQREVKLEHLGQRPLLLLKTTPRP